jgi:manganese/zinc/iron transport system substrate-binding protein
MGPGVDPHAYRQTRSDIVATANADLVLWHGLYLEAQMEEFLIELGRDPPGGRRRRWIAAQPAHFP